MITKMCRDCHNEWPLTAFQRNSSSKDGRRPECKMCCAEKVANDPKRLARKAATAEKRHALYWEYPCAEFTKWIRRPV